MDLFEHAFGGEFEPHLDKDAALKLILHCLFIDRELERLTTLLDQTLNIGGLEGQPRWELARIEDQDRRLPGYSEWPKWACYRANVRPDEYPLSYPTAYYKAEEFSDFVTKVHTAYCARYPDQSHTLKKLLSLLQQDH